ncbi:MFS transporter [Macrococcus sp. EM39E]|uniref:MFS transporter n=1 Tax=Macrococcus animalis TaxID=3395467 RepID=UPI0039BDCB9E
MKIRELPINIHVRLWGSFVNRIAGSSVWPFMALYLTEAVDKTFAGTFLSFTVLLSFFINIIAGYVCDRLPRKKLLVSMSYLEVVCILIMAMGIYFDTLIPFLVGFVLNLVVGQFRRPALRAIVQDSATNENRKIIYQLDYWLINLSLALGAAIGGLFYHDHKLLLFLILAFSSLIIAIVYTIFISETRAFIAEKTHKNVFKDLLHSYIQVSKNKPFVILVIGSICIMYAELSTSSYVAVRLAETFETIDINGFKMTGVRMFSTINIVNTLIVVTFTFIVGRLIQKFKVKQIMICGLVIYGLGYVILTSANNLWIILLAITIATFGELIYAPIKNAEELDLIPADQRGAYGAFSNLGFNATDLMTKFAIILGAYLNPYAMSGVMFVIVLIGSICYMSSLFVKTES